MVNEWKKEYSEIAQKYGWDVFAVDGDPSRLEIQQLDDSAIYAGDEEARRFVAQHASNGVYRYPQGVDGRMLQRVCDVAEEVTKEGWFEKYYLENSNSCSQCGSNDLDTGETNADYQTLSREVSCCRCGAAWTDVYNMVGMTNFKKGTKPWTPK